MEDTQGPAQRLATVVHDIKQRSSNTRIRRDNRQPECGPLARPTPGTRLGCALGVLALESMQHTEQGLVRGTMVRWVAEHYVAEFRSHRRSGCSHTYYG